MCDVSKFRGSLLTGTHKTNTSWDPQVYSPREARACVYTWMSVRACVSARTRVWARSRSRMLRVKRRRSSLLLARFLILLTPLPPNVTEWRAAELAWQVAGFVLQGFLWSMHVYARKHVVCPPADGSRAPIPPNQTTVGSHIPQDSVSASQHVLISTPPPPPPHFSTSEYFPPS